MRFHYSEGTTNMNKTVKKLDNNVVQALTKVCDFAKANIDGFVWLTHTADYSNFPNSLVVTCVFDTQQSLDQARSISDNMVLIKLVHQHLLKAGILLKQAKHNVRFDCEENGAKSRLL